MKKRSFAWFAAFALLLGTFLPLANTAGAAEVSLRADNFRRGESGGQWTVLVDVTATNVGDAGVVTRIYDLSFYMQAYARDMKKGPGSRLGCKPSFSAPKEFAELKLAPGESATASLSVPYVDFKDGGDDYIRWRWVGEEKHKDFSLEDLRVSDIQAKVDPGGVVVKMMTPEAFSKLCEKGTPQEIEAEIKKGAQVNPPSEHMDDPDPPLMAAARSNPDPEVLLLLLKHGANVAPATFSLTGPLHVASTPQVASILLDHGADVNAWSLSYSGSVLYGAMSDPSPSLELIRLLLDRGADINKINGKGQSALEYAEEKLKDTEIYKLIKERTTQAGGKAANSDAIVLSAKDANLSEAPDVIVEPNTPPYNLGGWRVHDNKVLFPVDIKKAGNYRVTLVYSKQTRDGDVADLKITAGKESALAPIPFTGNDWSSYVEKDVAVLNLPAGKTDLAFESAAPKGNRYVMNLRSVRLTPSAD